LVRIPRNMRRVYSSEMPPYQYKLLIWWAFCDRKTKTTLAKDILVARAEANSGLIVDQKLPDYAADFDCTPDELMQLIIEADAVNYSNIQLHDILAEQGYQAALVAVRAKAKAKDNDKDGG
jgi:hypothetical protein